MREAQTPDEASVYCEEIVRRFEPLLLKMWRRRPVADYGDFVQDVFLRLFRSLPKLREPKAFPGFFRTIALSVLMDAWRGHVPEEPLTAELASAIADIDRSTCSDLVARSYLQMLPEQMRAIVQMTVLDDLPSAAVADQLGLTAGGARSLKTRALRELRRIVTAEADELEKKRGR